MVAPLRWFCEHFGEDSCILESTQWVAVGGCLCCDWAVMHVWFFCFDGLGFSVWSVTFRGEEMECGHFGGCKVTCLSAFVCLLLCCAGGNAHGNGLGVCVWMILVKILQDIVCRK
jgi:hypothetical protein